MMRLDIPSLHRTTFVALTVACSAAVAAPLRSAQTRVSVIPVSSLPTFKLTSQASAAGAPFALGQVFKKGSYLPSETVVADTLTSQVIPISLWDDGSVKHALVAGTANLSAQVAQTVSLSKSAAIGGAPLTEADLIAAQPQASISYGAHGSADLGSLLGSPAKTIIEQAGPQYAAFQYIAPFPGDPSVRAIFYVQLWRGGRYRVRVAVENGTAPGATSAKSGTATVSIAGATVFSGAVSMGNATRWDAIGANFNLPRVGHDVAYLRASKLVPNFGYRNPSPSAITALPISYTPMGGMLWTPSMGDTGYQEAIGILPHWDALYLTSGDSRAGESSLQHGRAYGAYGVFFRDAASKRMPKFSDFPTAYANSESLSGNYVWEFAHHPNAGYLPWLLTAERFHLETIQANAWAAYYTNHPTSSGTAMNINALRDFNSQTRGRAWRFRTVAAAAAVSPTGDPIAADYRAILAANLNKWKTVSVDPNRPATAFIAVYGDHEPAPGLQHSMFESLFLVSTLGWAWDIEPGFNASQKSTHKAVRDFVYRIPVGLTGRGPAFGEYSWRHAPGPYRTTIGPNGSDSLNLYSTFSQIYTATYNDNLDSSPGLPILDSYADDASSYSFPQGNWGHVLTALSYAVDHGAPGAIDGYGRVTGASNWSRNAVKFNDWPQYGILPR